MKKTKGKVYVPYKNKIKSAVDWLRLELCQCNTTDMDDNKLTCRESLYKRLYEKDRCESCEKIDKAFQGLIPISHKQSKNK